MAQLTSFTLDDLYLISTFSSILAPYLAEEIEATVESVSPYIYSAN
jgi:hypothetical protein